MGLYDRDYMRNRHKEGGFQKRHLQRVNVSNTWKPWKIALVTIGAFALLFVVSTRYLDKRPLIPFPMTGEVHWYAPPPEKNSAPLGITAPAGDKRNFVVLLNDWGSSALVAIIPIRSGEVAEVQVPLGRYQITIASGKSWLGPEKMFGGAGEIRKAVAPMDFYRSGNQTMGHRIDLANRINGNMETRPKGPFEK